jgi:ribonuclease Z
MTRKHGLIAHHEGNWVEQSPVEPRADHSGYFPNTEHLGPDEMRVIILGSGMPNARKSQASASILVELGNGDKFLFDCGSESVANLGSLEIPYDWLDKVFISHLHQDHFAEIPAGGGELEVHEFDYRGENEIVYNENDVIVRSFPAVHAIDGSVSYSLEWNGLKFIFGGDTYPNKWFVEYSKGADIAIHECFPTMDQLVDQYKFAPPTAINVAIHVHTAPSAFGAVMDLVKPRMAIAYHFYNDFDTRYDVYEQIRTTYDGPLTLATDLLVFNITKDKIRVREAIVNHNTWPAPPASAAEPPDHTLLVARSKFINDGMMADLVNKAVGAELADFKKRRGME